MAELAGALCNPGCTCMCLSDTEFDCANLGSVTVPYCVDSDATYM